jgi:hypothetical protein
MGPNIGNSSSRLSRLQNIHAELLRKKAALEILRKQVLQKEAAREAKIAYGAQWTKKSPRTSHRQARPGG